MIVPWSRSTVLLGWYIRYGPIGVLPCQDSNVKRRSLPRMMFPPPLRLHLHGVFTGAGPTSSAVSRRTVAPHALRMPVLQPPSMPRALTLRTWSPGWGPRSTVVVWPGLFLIQSDAG